MKQKNRVVEEVKVAKKEVASTVRRSVWHLSVTNEGIKIS